MDSLRAGWDDPFKNEGDLDDDEDFIGVEVPPSPVGQDERRLQVRAYNHWASLLGDRRFPRIDDLDFSNPPDFEPNAVLLDFAGGIDNPQIRHIGAVLGEECSADIEIKRLNDVPGRSLLSRITDHYMQIIANEAPIGFEAEFINNAGRTLLYRGILLPFSDDGQLITQILGVINWKELADQATTDQLLREIDAALAAPVPAAPAPGADPHFDAWADGPSIGHGPVAPDDDVLDLSAHPQLLDGAVAWPEPGFADGDPLAWAGEASLADLLGRARELALLAHCAEDRSHQALYAAIGEAWDFALASADDPQEFADLLADAGLAAQLRAPLTPVVKLVFGAHYDKTRLAEYAAVLAHAQRLGLGRGMLAGHLAQTTGGIKAVVQAERAARRGLARAARSTGPSAALARKLRKIAPVDLATLAGDGAEFTVLIARRDGGGVAVLGEAEADQRLVARLARGLLNSK